MEGGDGGQRDLRSLRMLIDDLHNMHVSCHGWTGLSRHVYGLLCTSRTASFPFYMYMSGLMCHAVGCSMGGCYI